MALRNVAIFLAVLGLPGCTGESSFSLPLSDAGAPSARDEAPCATWAKTECAYRGHCPFFSISSRWENDAQCLERRTLQCELEAADPDVRFDPVAVAGCAYPSDCESPVPGLCLPPGKAADRAACLWNEACASGLCLVSYVYDVPNACGACFTPRSCSITCDAGAACVSDVDGGDRCVTMPAMPVASLGESCGSDAGAPMCVDLDVEVYCDETQHCRAYQPASYGQPCAQTDGGAMYLCEAYGSCTSLDTLTCVAPAADGALCDDLQGLGCLPPARCHANHCAFPSMSWCAN